MREKLLIILGAGNSAIEVIDLIEDINKKSLNIVDVKYEFKNAKFLKFLNFKQNIIFIKLKNLNQRYSENFQPPPQRRKLFSLMIQTE